MTSHSAWTLADYQRSGLARGAAEQDWMVAYRIAEVVDASPYIEQVSVHPIGRIAASVAA